MNELKAMSSWKTAAEWSAERLAGLPATESGLIRLSKRESWNDLGPSHARKRKGRGGGWEYHVSCLPDAAQADWQRRQRAAEATAVATRESVTVKARAAETSDKIAAHRRRVMEARGGLMVELRRREFLCGSTSKAIEGLLSEGRAGLLPPALRQMLSDAVEKGRGENPMPSRSRLYAWRAAYDQGGVNALLPEARPQESPQEVPAWMGGLLRHYGKPSKPSLTMALEMFTASLDNPKDAPSYDQARRALKALTGTGRYLDAHKGREGPLALKARMGFVRRTTEGMEPAEVYTADGKTFEAEVAHPVTGKPFRPEITAILDVTTRKLVGWSVDLAENSRGVAEALRHAAVTNGIAAIFYTDRGPGFRNKALDDRTQGILGRLGSTPTHSLPYVSQSRGIIERSHQTIWTRAAKSLPSYVGADMDREARMARDKRRDGELRVIGGSRLLPTWGEFVACVEAEAVAYNDRPHSALRIKDPETGRMRTASPNEVWADFVMRGFEPIMLPADEADDVFRQYVRRTCLRGEVRWNSNQYYHDALQPFDGMEVFVGIDVQDAERVWVRRADQDGEGMGPLICVAGYWNNKVRYKPHSLTEKAKEDRLKGQLRRAMDRVDKVDAEWREVALIDAEPAVPAPFIDLAPTEVVEMAPVANAPAVGHKALPGRRVHSSYIPHEDVELAAEAVAHPERMTVGWHRLLTFFLEGRHAEELLEGGGVDPDAVRKVLDDFVPPPAATAEQTDNTSRVA